MSYVGFALVLFAYCYKKSYKKSFFFLSTLPNVVTTGLVCYTKKKNENKA